jgi:hypothetical protein
MPLILERHVFVLRLITLIMLRCIKATLLAVKLRGHRLCEHSKDGGLLSSQAHCLLLLIYPASLSSSLT